MIWIILALLLVIAIVPSAEDRERSERWKELLDDIERKNEPLD